MTEMFDGEEILDEPDDWELGEPPVQESAPSTENEQDPGVDKRGPAQPYPIICLADVEPEPVDWLWEKRIPRNMITVIEGHPSTGKSTIIMDLVSRLSTGAAFPFDDRTRDPMTILWVTQEDSPSQVLLPRLLAAGGEPKGIFVQTKVDILGGQSYRSDILEAAWDRVYATVDLVNPHVVVYDPGSSLLEDGNSEAVVRQVMGRIFDMSQERAMTTIWIRHLAKAAAAGDAMMAGIGSIGISAAARSVLQVHTDFQAQRENDPHPRIMAHIKSNLGPLTPTLKFGMMTKRLEGYEGIDAAEIFWGGESDLTAEQMIQKNMQVRSKVPKVKVVEEFEKWAQKKGEFSPSEALARINEIAKTSSQRLKDSRHWKTIQAELNLEQVGTRAQTSYRYSKLT